MYLKTWKEFETASYNLLLKDPTRVITVLLFCYFVLRLLAPLKEEKILKIKLVEKLFVYSVLSF
jgi:hypothetical protein